MASILPRKTSARFVETNGPDAGDLFLLWNLTTLGLLFSLYRIRIMWTRLLCVAAIFVGLAPQAKAAEQHRISCPVVRFYVAKYTVSAAESWARSKGAGEAEIEAARRCLKDAPVQTAADVSTLSH
jgi:hypothetical protein